MQIAHLFQKGNAHQLCIRHTVICESGVFVNHRLGTRGTSTYPELTDHAHSTLSPTSSCPIMIATESSQLKLLVISH